jgi:uncharacterized integral membrane protein
MIASRKRLRKGLWHLPNRILEVRGDFLGEKPDRFVRILARVRSALGLVVLAGIAFTYPGFTEPMSELVSTADNTPADVVAASRLADTCLTQVLYGLVIALLCIVVFAVLMVVLTRSGKRLLMLRHLCQPLIAFALFAVLMGLIVGIFSLLGRMTNGLTGSPMIAVVDFVILVILFLTVGPTLAVVYVKSIYLAAVYVFRADDAHPLLAPFATTVVAWSLASAALIAGGPTGVPYGLGLLIVFTGPLTVSMINALACRRLWLKHHDLLFRDGPRVPGLGTPRTAASSSASGIPG